MISVIDKPTANRLGKEIMEAIEQVAARHGLAAKRGRGTYDKDSFSISKVELICKSEDGEVMSSEAKAAFFKVVGTVF